jgi:signal peptidase
MTSTTETAPSETIASPVQSAAGELEPTDAPRERGLLHYIGLGASGALLVAVIALALILIVIPKVAGATPLTVLTASMEPLYPPGTLIYVLPVKPADIRLGDVITYQIDSGKPAVISHRVIAINSPPDGKRTFILKGDNNSQADPTAVLPVQIRGRLWYSVPLFGWVNSALNGTKRSWIVDALAAALFAYAGYMIISGFVAALRKRKKTITRS